MKLFFYQSKCGNAARMQFTGTDGLIHNVFVDAGFERTFRHVLIKEIQEIINNQQIIDAWIISHIHDDHIGGALAYIKAIQSGEIRDVVSTWYYNPPRGILLAPPISTNSHISEAKSIAQGDKVASYLSTINKLPLTDITTDTSTVDLNGLKLTFLSPNSATLAVLRQKYPAGGRNRFERNEMDTISQPSAAVASDYRFVLKDFESIPKKPDNSVENGSSISLLAEYNGKKILWLADAFPGVIIGVLKKIGYSVTNPLKCEWVNVAHHGSSGNNTPELYRHIDCSNYLISADGNNTAKLPTKACLSSILLNRHRAQRTHLYFIYDNKTLRSIFESDGSDVYDKYNFEAHYCNHPVIAFDL
jgi:hypothetical protein